MLCCLMLLLGWISMKDNPELYGNFDIGGMLGLFSGDIWLLYLIHYLIN